MEVLPKAEGSKNILDMVVRDMIIQEEILGEEYLLMLKEKFYMYQLVMLVDFMKVLQGRGTTNIPIQS